MMKGGSIPVALYTSAWIEILLAYRHNERKQVALYTSAWIEILTLKAIA